MFCFDFQTYSLPWNWWFSQFFFAVIGNFLLQLMMHWKWEEREKQIIQRMLVRGNKRTSILTQKHWILWHLVRKFISIFIDNSIKSQWINEKINIIFPSKINVGVCPMCGWIYLTNQWLTINVIYQKSHQSISCVENKIRGQPHRMRSVSKRETARERKKTVFFFYLVTFGRFAFSSRYFVGIESIPNLLVFGSLDMSWKTCAQSSLRQTQTKVK